MAKPLYVCFTKGKQPQPNLWEEQDDMNFKVLKESLMNLPAIKNPNYQIPFFFLYMKGKGTTLGSSP